MFWVILEQYYNAKGLNKLKPIDSWHLTSRRPCWRYNTKKYVISYIVGSSRRWWQPLESLSKRRFCQHGRHPEVNRAVVDGE